MIDREEELSAVSLELLVEALYLHVVLGRCLDESSKAQLEGEVFGLLLVHLPPALPALDQIELRANQDDVAPL
eukprot:CAMPEP_0168626248 /NCGR_PEP_ID=MMETSP0449_2-20121227/10514_1 /TAXON_ID=1082188 /ORGANISM="Strombidium rassoulzadegani, Strain ras09" /LENGTH=72 /DNA_ID=CAMNT_0008668197 /DNA_START=259 /DNA_END=477 /DNA_ORIENTATION=+